ncbi:unnamed protein product [Symbiodinium sp. KB8]|nr:unnamed protein product [Symbiodinium sp. KB8]
MTGFTVSYAVALLLFFPTLYAVLRMVWVLAEEGPARKCMTTFFILSLSLPLYPVLAALLLVLIWLILGFAVLVVSTFGPAALGLFALMQLWEVMENVVTQERAKTSQMRRRNSTVQDITCWELLCGLLVGILSCGSFGVLAFALTILKSPLVILSVVLRFVYESLCRWLVLVHCRCRPFCCCCATSAVVQVGESRESRSVSELRSEGYSAKDLKDLGARAGDLYDAGFTIGELREEAEFSSRDFNAAGLGAELLWHEHGGSGWWWWFPLIFLTWLSAVVCLVSVMLLVVILVALAKLILAVVWPAYISAGWLRILAQTRRRQSARTCCEPLVQGLKAGYQVVWAGSMLTNIYMLNKTLDAKAELVKQTVEECSAFASGDRAELSPNLQSLSIFPPVEVGLFTDSWDLRLRILARKLGVSEDVIQEAWRGLGRQMIRLGREALESGLLTEDLGEQTDFVEAIPGELCIGLPARAMLEAVERSPRGELQLVGGLRILEHQIPKLKFAEKVWGHFRQAQDARMQVQIGADVHRLLCAALLAGGGDPDALPAGLAEAMRRYEELPKSAYDACQAIVRPLIGFGLECGSQPEFREKLELVIQSMTQVDSEELEQYLYAVPFADDDLEAGGSESSEGTDSECMPAAPLRALGYTSAGGSFAKIGGDNKPMSSLMKIGYATGTGNVYCNKIVLMDEAHNLVRSQTQYAEQLQRLRRLLYEARSLVLAGFTGTPILSEPSEGRQLLDIIKGVMAPDGDEGYLSSFPMRPQPLFPVSLPRGLPDGVLTLARRRQLIRKATDFQNVGASAEDSRFRVLGVWN